MVDSRTLAEVRRAEWDSPKDFLEKARHWISEVEAYEALYDGLRHKISYLLRSGAPVEQISSWQNALSTVMGLASKSDHSTSEEASLLHQRLNVLRDFSSDLISQLNLFSVKALKDQPHFQACLKLLSENDSALPRKKILQMLGLKEANGTRVLKTLEAEKLIRREKRGRDVTVKLTSEGRRSL